MEINWLLYSVLGTSIIAIVGLSLILLLWKYIKFGLELTIKKNILLVFIADAKNNLGWPKIANINSDNFTYNDATYVWNSEAVKEGSILGFPYVIFNAKDTRSTAGIYWHNVEYDEKNDQFNPKFHKIVVKEGITKKVPDLQTHKSSVVMGTTFMRTVIMNEAFRLAITDFIKKNKTVLYTLFGIGIACGITLYFIWTLHSDILPPMIEKLDIIIELLRAKNAN
jgi:hypothetical protein